MIRLLFAVAVAAFVLALPVWKTELGAKLRRVAGFSFTAALMPSLVIGLFFPNANFADPMWLLVGVPIVVICAYVILRYRAAARVSPMRPQRPLQKTPVDRLRRREQEFFSFIADRQESRED